MAIQPILRMGNPLLWRKSEQIVEFNTPQLTQWVKTLMETKEANQGVGIAAPQIGLSKQIILIGLKDNPRYPDIEEEIPTELFINPILTPKTQEKQVYLEACLSVPGLRGKVPRYTHLHYRAQTLTGEFIEGEASGFKARILQHECDHLNGLLYPCQLTQIQDLGFEKEMYAST